MTKLLEEVAAHPIALDFVYDAEPERWTPEQLAAAVAQQRTEREAREAKKAAKAARTAAKGEKSGPKRRTAGTVHPSSDTVPA